MKLNFYFNILVYTDMYVHLRTLRKTLEKTIIVESLDSHSKQAASSLEGATSKKAVSMIV